MQTAFVVREEFKVGLQLGAEAVFSLQAKIQTIAAYLVLVLCGNIEIAVAADKTELPLVLVIQLDATGVPAQE